MITRFLARALAEGISGWLAFEFSAHRGALFSEHYLVQPAGQILQAFSQKNEINTEVTHPLLKQPERGRPYQLDYTIGDKENPKVAIEAKSATWTPSSKRLIVADLLRLALLTHYRSTDCIFLLAGRLSHLETIQSQIPFLPFNFSQYRVTRRVKLDTIRSISETGYADIEALAKMKIPERMYITGPYGQIHGSRKLSFHALTWRIRRPRPTDPTTQKTQITKPL